MTDVFASTSHWVGAGLVAMQAGWVTLGAITNVRCPQHNLDYVHNVLSMALIREESPHLYKKLKGRRIARAETRHALFRALMGCEMLVCILLWTGVVLMVMAEFGTVDPMLARTVSLAAVFAFTAIWGAFLVGGEWFAYYGSANSPQYTHFYMLLWGVGTLIYLR